MSKSTVLAAGGLVVRGAGSDPEVVVVHRPKYDDWSLPKGKLEPGETREEAALREVREETGLRCVATRRLPAVHYRDPQGRPKEVTYYLMRVVEGRLRDRAADAEVDGTRWVAVRAAAALLTYPLDRQLLSAACTDPES